MMPKPESLPPEYPNTEVNTNESVPAGITKTHFDLYTRYFLIARLADQVRTKTPMTILDVGGEVGLLRSFLKEDEITIMDTSSSVADSIIGDITQAPFESQSFDLVVSTDVYEHIQPAKRAKAISEMLRLSRNFVILGGPFYSSEVELAEVTANNFWLKATGEPHRWLREHIDNKLPCEKELESLLKESGYEFYKFGTNNLFMWLMLMLFSFHAQRCQVSQDKIGEVWHFYNRNFADLGDFEEPTYRKIYLIGNQGTLPKLSLYENSRIDRLKQHKLTSLVFDTILETGAQRLSRIAELETNLQEKVSQIHSLEYQIQQIQQSIPMQLVSRYQRIVEKLLRRGTRRRYYYELGLRGIRVVLNEGWKIFFRRARYRLVHRRAAIKRPRHDLPKFNASISKKEADKLIFPVPSEKPEVSIVIPAYNNWRYTLNCLKSIAKNTDGDYEVVVINDASTDATAEVLPKVKNLHLVTNKQNAGFTESCNRGARTSKGRNVLFLNNDTMVAKGWLPPLLEIIKGEDVGAVGSKLAYPKGTLREAGSIVWRDGSASSYGQGDDSSKPEYNYVREVDYCSSASLMVKRELFKKIGGLGKRFKPSYYEDTDLCFAIRDMGYKVIYQPMSVVVHCEGVTRGTDTSVGIKKYQEINRPKFVEKWSSVLQKRHYPPVAENAFLARDRVPGKRILVIDNCVPTYDKDAGSFDMFSMLKILVELGNKVTFIGDNLLRLEPYTQGLQQKGIEVIYAPYVFSAEAYIEKYGRFFDVVILSRANIAMKHLAKVKWDCFRAKVIYDTVDLHFLRESRQAIIENNEKLLKQAERTKTTELRLAKNSDITFVVSPVEKEILLKEDPSLKVEVIIRSVHSVKSPQKQFVERKDILFIGGFAHLPNVDAVVYFVKEIFPLIKQRMPDVRFYIVGSNPPKQVLSLQSNAVVVTGYIKDVAPYFENCKVFVASLRYGAGVKGKILLSMSYGVPVVTTSIGSEGIGLVDGQNVLVADDPQEFAQKVILLCNEEELWSKLSRNSLEHIRRCFSHEMAKEQFNNLMKNL